MSTLTPNFSFILPQVNDPTDQDLWGGYLNSNWSSLDTLLQQVKTAAQLPVGGLYCNATDATNPGTSLGYGTWIAFGQGQVLIGVGTGTDANSVSKTFAAGDTGGEYVHTLTTPEIPAHDHIEMGGPTNTNITLYGSGSGINFAGSGQTDNGSNYQHTASTGGGGTHNNIQTYITVYIWTRTA